MQIGSIELKSAVILAPMAGVSDLPMRKLCRRYGAGLAVSEMVASRPELRHTATARQRLEHGSEQGPRSVQLVGCNPADMADTARFAAELGADIIDINMGCPAKKVCNLAAGSALLRDEALVASILEAVVAAVSLPVTLKIRTGWCPQSRNATTIARIAEAAGIAALTIHGRTRACRFKGEAEYDTIRSVKEQISIPVIANGDIDSVEKALEVLSFTGADGVMIGRAAQGQPWFIREVAHALAYPQASGTVSFQPDLPSLSSDLIEQVLGTHELYGRPQGVRIARKHVSWTLQRVEQDGGAFRQAFNQTEDPDQQLRLLGELPQRMASPTRKKTRDVH